MILPRVVQQATPRYPIDPYNQWVQGTVGLELVVAADGAIGDVRVARSLNPDLDEAAIASARQWRFQPGSKDGAPVSIVVTMEVAFRRTR